MKQIVKDALFANHIQTEESHHPLLVVFGKIHTLRPNDQTFSSTIMFTTHNILFDKQICFERYSKISRLSVQVPKKLNIWLFHVLVVQGWPGRMANKYTEKRYARADCQVIFTKPILTLILITIVLSFTNSVSRTCFLAFILAF